MGQSILPPEATCHPQGKPWSCQACWAAWASSSLQQAWPPLTAQKKTGCHIPRSQIQCAMLSTFLLEEILNLWEGPQTHGGVHVYVLETEPNTGKAEPRTWKICLFPWGRGGGDITVHASPRHLFLRFLFPNTIWQQHWTYVGKHKEQSIFLTNFWCLLLKTRVPKLHNCVSGKGAVLCSGPARCQIFSCVFSLNKGSPWAHGRQRPCAGSRETSQVVV